MEFNIKKLKFELNWTEPVCFGTAIIREVDADPMLKFQFEKLQKQNLKVDTVYTTKTTKNRIEMSAAQE